MSRSSDRSSTLHDEDLDPLLASLFQDFHTKGFSLTSPEQVFTTLSSNRNALESPAGVAIGQGLDLLQSNQNTSLGHSSSGRIRTKSLSSKHQASHSSTKNSDLIQTSDAMLGEGLMYQHVSLANRGVGLQNRVVAVLGKIAYKHYSHQLDALKNKLFELQCSTVNHTLPEPQSEIQKPVDEEQISLVHKEPLKPRDVENLAHNGQAVLQGLLESLDSDATESSSEEEWDVEDTNEASHVCEYRWLKDRAELGSRWTWLEMSLSDLDSQNQRIEKLHQQIVSEKVALAETPPLTDSRSQHTLSTETMDRSFTADFHSDPETEPSSPTRLLRNIEKQSAQLTQMISFNALSPISKVPSNHWRGQKKTAKISGPQFLQKAKPKRKRACHRKLDVPQVKVGSMSAQTRPFLTHHKPRLFIMEQVPHRELCTEKSPCDLLLCTNPVCLHQKEQVHGKVYPVLSLSSETSLSSHLKNALFKESVLQRSFLSMTNQWSPHQSLRSRSRVCRALFQCSHRTSSERHVQRDGGKSPPAPEHCRRPYRTSKRRRCYSQKATDTLISTSTVLTKSKDSSNADGKTTYCIPSQRRVSKFPLQGRSRDNVDDIINNMSPFSSVILEALEYNNILTPSWRILNISPLLKLEADELDMEPLEKTDNADFFRRHQLPEIREKLQRSRSAHGLGHKASRSSSSLSGSVNPTHCDAQGFSSSSKTWSHNSSQNLLEDTEPVLPWKRRNFPLTEENEEN